MSAKGILWWKDDALPWDDWTDRFHAEMGDPRDVTDTTIRRWLTERSRATDVEFSVVWAERSHSIWCGTHHDSRKVMLPLRLERKLDSCFRRLSVWHNHPDHFKEHLTGSGALTGWDLGHLGRRGVIEVGVVNNRGEWSTVCLSPTPMFWHRRRAVVCSAMLTWQRLHECGVHLHERAKPASSQGINEQYHDLMDTALRCTADQHDLELRVSIPPRRSQFVCSLRTAFEEILHVG